MGPGVEFMILWNISSKCDTYWIRVISVVGIQRRIQRQIQISLKPRSKFKFGTLNTNIPFWFQRGTYLPYCSLFYVVFRDTTMPCEQFWMVGLNFYIK